MAASNARTARISLVETIMLIADGESMKTWERWKEMRAILR